MKRDNSRIAPDKVCLIKIQLYCIIFLLCSKGAVVTYKFGIIGSFNKDAATDGQTVKTLEIVKAFKEKYGDKNIGEFSYHAVKGNPLKLTLLILSALKNSEKLVLTLRGDAMRTLVKIINILNVFFKRELHFILVGGALYDVLDKNPDLIPLAKRIKTFFVETDILKDKLLSLGLRNVYMLSNFKYIKLFKKEELPENSYPLKLVFLSRVTALKGVTEAVEIIKKINSEKEVFSLDIYGPIDESFSEEFEALLKSSPTYINYKGVISAWESSEILHNYFLQLFPTRCLTEGHPASVIDSFFAGLPVLAARWNYCREMIKENEVGLSYEFDNFEEFEKILRECAENPEKITAMRVNCLKEAEKYLPSKVTENLFGILEGKE